MKPRLFEGFLAVTLFLVAFPIFGQRSSEGPYTKHQMGRGMSSLNQDLVQIANKTGLFLQLAGELNLTEAQDKELKALFFRTQTATVKRGADLDVADAELVRLLTNDDVDIAAVSKKVREIADIQADATLLSIDAALSAVKLLTHEQHLKIMLIVRSQKKLGTLNAPEG